jgi:hypothetical protein
MTDTTRPTDAELREAVGQAEELLEGLSDGTSLAENLLTIRLRHKHLRTLLRAVQTPLTEDQRATLRVVERMLRGLGASADADMLREQFPAAFPDVFGGATE